MTEIYSHSVVTNLLTDGTFHSGITLLTIVRWLLVMVTFIADCSFCSLIQYSCDKWPVMCSIRIDILSILIWLYNIIHWYSILMILLMKYWLMCVSVMLILKMANESNIMSMKVLIFILVFNDLTKRMPLRNIDVTENVYCLCVYVCWLVMQWRNGIVWNYSIIINDQWKK